jgi:hypothetical protein
MAGEQTTQKGRSPGSIWPTLRVALSVVWVPWLVARVLTGTALGLARYLVSHVDIGSAKAVQAAHEGLSSWDASWYVAIARDGYGALPDSATRFFPLFPETLHVGHLLSGAPYTVLGVVLANVASLLAAVLLYLLARGELDQTSANRAVWLFCLAPASFVLVMGYAESLLLCFVLGAFLAWRRGAFWWGSLLGVAAGLTRPLGIVLVLPALVYALSGFDTAATKAKVGRIASVLGPLVGTGIYLAWVASAFGDFLLPLRAQTAGDAHGGLSNPFVVAWDAMVQLFHGHVGTALHVPWIALALVLLVLCFRRLPLAYGLFAAGVLLAALSGHNLDSFERYALSAFPLVLVGGTLLRSERVALPVLVISSGGMVAYGLLAFLGAYVP